MSGALAIPGLCVGMIGHPDAAAAQTTAPQTTAPQTTAPQTIAPQTKAPSSAKQQAAPSAGTTTKGSNKPAPGGGIEQVTVTALRQRSTLQKAPAAITAVTSTTLDKSNINNAAGLNGEVPGLTVTRAAGFENLVNIRGVGSSTPENALTTQPGVAFFVDGVYLANSISLDQTFFDIDRVEVLRGPQGSLYGQSSTGGVINLVTNQPTLGVYSGKADWGIGNYNLFQERAEVNVPLSDTVAVRLSFQKYDHDGFGQAIDPPIAGYQLDDAHDISGKVALLWKPSDNFSATFSAQWYRAEQDGAEQKDILDPEANPRLVNQDYPGQFNLDTSLYHINLAWTLPFGTLTSVTGYQHLYNDQSEDSSRLSYAILHSYDDVAAWNTGIDSYSEDLSVATLPGGRIDAVAGIFLLTTRSNQFVSELEGTNPNPDLSTGTDIETNPPSNLGYGNVTAVTRDTAAGYAQATLHITNALRLTGGVRYNVDHYNAFDDNFSAFSASKANTTYTTERPTGNVNLQYDLTPRNLLYGSVTEGYKPGGVNGNADAKVVGLTFAPEGITSFEIGSKNRLLQDHLILNLAGFFYDYRNMQYIENDPYPYAYGIANVPNTHVWGGEAEASYRMLEGRLRFNGQFSLENGEVIGNYKAIDSATTTSVYASSPACAYGGQYYNPGCWAAVETAAKNIKGTLPPDLPRVQGEINVEYTMHVGPGALLSRAEFVYRGTEVARVFNDAGIDSVPSYPLYNLYFSYKPDHTRWLVSVALTNLGNVAGVTSRYTDPYGTAQTSNEYIPPFQAIGRISYSF
ncbi:TonB-dependent receptor [Lichenicoccus sp.]|uniref:TonB-dependent receptor n=1 Tax=Lichenicoccus sp. TaxID=2781899 RepID=UPI003D13DC0E